MIPLSKYKKIKNKLCVAYFGPTDDFVNQLLEARPHIEMELPGLDLYVACRDEVFERLHTTDRLLSYSQLRDGKDEFAYVRELRSNAGENPVTAILEESKIPVRKR